MHWLREVDDIYETGCIVRSETLRVNRGDVTGPIDTKVLISSTVALDELSTVCEQLRSASTETKVHISPVIL
jgi:hypothetical protein